MRKPQPTNCRGGMSKRVRANVPVLVSIRRRADPKTIGNKTNDAIHQ